MATVWLTILMAAIFGLFWNSQLVYSLPTPVPAGYHDVHTGEKIILGKRLDFNGHKPVFLHFFNPDCPCSRFNIDHFKTLVKNYDSKVDFAVVLMTNKSCTPAQIQKRFGITVPVIADPTLATACGVYSTPQAVLINTDQQLYYRGNYNKTRYCTDPKTSYATIALEDLLHQKKITPLGKFALKAYGCSTPNCTNQ